MRKLFLIIPAVFGLSACSEVLASISSATGLSTEDMLCIGGQVANMSSEAAERSAAGQIASACGINVEDVIFGADEVVVEAEGDTVVVAQ